MKQLFMLLIFLLLLAGCSQEEPQLLIHEQKTDSFVKYVEPLHVDMQSFNSREFLPWSADSMKISKKVASWANRAYSREDRYFAENLLLWDKESVKSIINSTNFERFNQSIDYAITTEDTQMRNLPTFKPFFRDPLKAGEGYPFDYMQNSRLHVNTPLLISHYSTDGAWAFVQNPISFGWLHRSSFALIDAKNRSELKKAKKIVILNDNSPIYTNTQEYLLHVKLGAQFPKTKESDDFFYSYMYTRFGNKVAVRIPKTQAKTMPIKFNQESTLLVSSELLKEKYGWGGYMRNRDCSSMTRDFFIPFGLWLPRNSAAQKNAGEYLSLKGLNNREKNEMILEHGIAFLTILYLRGHVMLYVGESNNRAMVLHNIWGIRTQTRGVEGRHVVGRAIVSDLHIGENLSNVKDGSLLIDRVEGILIKPDMPAFMQNAFVRVYPSIVKLKENRLYFDNNSTLKYHDHVEKTFKQMLDNPSIKDTISIEYDAFTSLKAPTHDSGRFRNETLLKKLYGKSKEDIEKNLVHVEWVDGSKVLFNANQNAARQLQKVVYELKKLPKDYDRFLTNIAGTFNYRNILNTNRLSSHSFGIAIDLNIKESSYWKWDQSYSYRNKIPKAIIDTFEKHGFIWGGRWYHYDTMHFEYRPEFFTTID